MNLLLLAEQLTAHEILKELGNLREWCVFGTCLEVPSNEMKKCKSVQDVIHKWLEIDHISHTWQKLVDALFNTKEIEIANKIASKYGKSARMW